MGKDSDLAGLIVMRFFRRDNWCQRKLERERVQAK